VTNLLETRDRVWSPVLGGLRADALDCVQTGLAALVDHAHGPDAHTVLGARLLAPRETAAGYGIEPPAAQRLAEAEELAGLRAAERRDGLDGPALRGWAVEAGALYVLADACDMPWTPYFGQRHMEHSYLLVPAGERWHVVDPYHNETQWGAARPGVWRLTAADLDATLGGGASALRFTAGPRPSPDPATILAGNARALAAARPDIDRYVTLTRAAVERGEPADRLVLDVWLLGRSRLLHAAWLATVPGLPAAALDAARERAQEWLRLASQSYLGLRRTQRGGALPPSIVERLAELLAADVELARSLSDEDPVRAAVVDAVRAVLDLGPETAVEPARAFRTLPNFNSFRLVDIIERLESGLGVDLDAEDLTLEALHDVDSLARIFAKAAGRVSR
jgi:hypothetical protein